MNSLKTKFLLVLLAGMFIASVPLCAQNIFSSPYSVYGIGMMNGRTSSLNRSIGGTGIGLQDDYSLNPVNPASYGSITSPISHVYEMGLYIESNRYTTQARRESRTTGGLNNLNYWFKFKPWWSSVVGLSPFSSVSYKINTTRQLGSGSDVNYTYEGSGNINQLYWGNAFTIVKNLSVGFNASYLFGSITKSESIDPSSETSLLTYQNQIIARKLDIDAGIQYKINFKKRALVLGVIADDGLTLTGNQKSALYDENADTLNSSKGDNIRYKLPASVGFGLSLLSKRSTIAADLKFENWSRASFPDQDVIFQDTWKFSAGYIHKGNPDGATYLSAVSLRTGFYVQNYYLKLKGTNFPIWGLSAGISFPVFDGKSAINLTYSLDQLGTTQNTLILQRSQKIMLDVVIRDLWGIKRKFD